MNRCILVCGIGCSGTSAVAGVLHKAGCPMHLPGHSSRRPEGVGYFEDRCFYGAFRGPPDHDVRNLFAAHQQPPLWGLKNTLLAKSLHWVIPMLADIGVDSRIVAVHRELTASIQGRVMGKCPPGQAYLRRDAEDWAIQAQITYMAGLQSVNVPIHHVGFAALVKDPAGQVERLLEFAFFATGLTPDREKAISHVRPELKHS
jgi:hypothetical protein